MRELRSGRSTGGCIRLLTRPIAESSRLRFLRKINESGGAGQLHPTLRDHEQVLDVSKPPDGADLFTPGIMDADL